jgi:membrane associated rhomboid family serine protease
MNLDIVKFMQSLGAVTILVMVMWLVKAIDAIFFFHSLNTWGILPRRVDHLLSIWIAPFLHRDFEHLAFNSLPFWVLGFVIAFRGIRRFYWVSFFIVTLSGWAVWQFARPAYHIGASGLIFGYVGYFFASFFFHARNFYLFGAIAILTVLYSGLFWQMFGTDPRLSFESHLFGFLAGFLVAIVIEVTQKNSLGLHNSKSSEQKSKH